MTLLKDSLYFSHTNRKTEMATKHTHEWFNEKIADADARGSDWLARGNTAREAGDNVKAEQCYGKGQYWLDRSNVLHDQRGYLLAGIL